MARGAITKLGAGEKHLTCGAWKQLKSGGKSRRCVNYDKERAKMIMKAKKPARKKAKTTAKKPKQGTAATKFNPRDSINMDSLNPKILLQGLTASMPTPTK
jgi:hypothetical protein